jgi:hypothetical protein
MMRIRSKLELHTYSWWWLNSQSIFKPSPLTLLQTGPWESRLEATSLPKSFLGRHKDKSLYSILQSSMWSTLLFYFTSHFVLSSLYMWVLSATPDTGFAHTKSPFSQYSSFFHFPNSLKLEHNSSVPGGTFSNFSTCIKPFLILSLLKPCSFPHSPSQSHNCTFMCVGIWIYFFLSQLECLLSKDRVHAGWSYFTLPSVFTETIMEIWKY